MLRRKSFEQYLINQRIIERLEGDPCIVSDTVVGSSTELPYAQHPIKVQGVSERVLRRNRRIIDELEARCAEVDAEIATMPDRLLALILVNKYMIYDHVKWDEVGEHVGLPGYDCSRRVNSYFKQLDSVETEGFNKRTKRKAAGFK